MNMIASSYLVNQSRARAPNAIPCNVITAKRDLINQNRPRMKMYSLQSKGRVRGHSEFVSC
jgi:hypothetical protein